MNPLTSAVLRTGLVDPDLLQQFRRWGVVFEDVPAAKPQTIDEVADRIQEALESQDLVLVRETDLSVLDEYIKSARRGTLRVVVDEDHQGEFPVTFGLTKLGEFVLPWMSSSIADVLTNGMTHLWDEGEPVYFSQVRELFFGETKAFMICTRYSREPALPEHPS